MQKIYRKLSLLFKTFTNFAVPVFAIIKVILSVILGENNSENALAGGLIEKLSSLMVSSSDRFVKVFYLILNI
jgi:hypothetical protein